MPLPQWAHLVPANTFRVRRRVYAAYSTKPLGANVWTFPSRLAGVTAGLPTSVWRSCSWG
ncbi:MAG: hypothetical protein FJW40_26505 [Acidobacteria bacterium]|nr:hypothetical protein [Acidobacteriota bacterium]